MFYEIIGTFYLSPLRLPGLLIPFTSYNGPYKKLNTNYNT